VREVRRAWRREGRSDKSGDIADGGREKGGVRFT
jgi:hypothetical protein